MTKRTDLSTLTASELAAHYHRQDHVDLVVAAALRVHEVLDRAPKLELDGLGLLEPLAALEDALIEVEAFSPASSTKPEPECGERATGARDQNDLDRIASRVTYLRGLRGLSPAELARAVGVPVRAIVDIEVGRGSAWVRIPDLAAALKVDPSWLDLGLDSELEYVGKPASSPRRYFILEPGRPLDETIFDGLFPRATFAEIKETMQKTDGEVADVFLELQPVETWDPVHADADAVAGLVGITRDDVIAAIPNVRELTGEIT